MIVFKSELRMTNEKSGPRIIGLPGDIIESSPIDYVLSAEKSGGLPARAGHFGEIKDATLNGISCVCIAEALRQKSGRRILRRAWRTNGDRRKVCPACLSVNNIKAF